MRSLLLSAIIGLLTAMPALAQREDAANTAPPETVSVVYVALFGVIFIGMIVGFFVYLWWGERKEKPQK